jgi:hypothetical protein
MTKLIFTLCIFSLSLKAEDANQSDDGYKTVLGKSLSQELKDQKEQEKKKWSGGFGGFVMRVSGINGNDGIFFGGRGGYYPAENIAFGGGGYSLSTDINDPIDISREVTLGYGGVFVEYFINPKNIINFSVVGFLGAGSVGSDSKIYKNDEINQSVYIFEPEVNLRINWSRRFNTTLNMGYRLVAGLTDERLKNTNPQNGFVGLNFVWSSLRP